MRRYAGLMCLGFGLALWLDGAYSLLWSIAYVLAIYRLDLALGAFLVAISFFTLGTVLLSIAERLYRKKP